MKLIIATTPAKEFENWDAKFVLVGNKVTKFVQGHPDNEMWIDGFLSGILTAAPDTMVRSVDIAGFDLWQDKPNSNGGMHTEKYIQETVGRLISESTVPVRHQMLIQAIGQHDPQLQDLKPGASYQEIVLKIDRTTGEEYPIQNRLLTYDGFGFFSSKDEVNITTMLKGFSFLQEML